MFWWALLYWWIFIDGFLLSITFLLGVDAFLRSIVAFERVTESSIVVLGVVAMV